MKKRKSRKNGKVALKFKIRIERNLSYFVTKLEKQRNVVTFLVPPSRSFQLSQPVSSSWCNMQLQVSAPHSQFSRVCWPGFKVQCLYSAYPHELYFFLIIGYSLTSFNTYPQGDVPKYWPWNFSCNFQNFLLLGCISWLIC